MARYRIVIEQVAYRCRRERQPCRRRPQGWPVVARVPVGGLRVGGRPGPRLGTCHRRELVHVFETQHQPEEQAKARDRAAAAKPPGLFRPIRDEGRRRDET
jgi:hypothetical protein